MTKIKNLKDLRKSKGITQTHISEVLGLSRQAVNLKETRKSPVSVSEARMLSQIYGTDIETIEKLCR